MRRVRGEVRRVSWWFCSHASPCVFASLLLVACSDDPKQLDQDASSVVPSGQTNNPDAMGPVPADAAVPDATGAAMDAGGGPADAARPDATSNLDSAQPVTPLDSGNDGGPADAGSDAASADAGSDAAPADAGPFDAASALADYSKLGEWKVTRMLDMGKGTISGGSAALLPLSDSNDPSAFTVWIPDRGTPERVPLLTFGNGTFCSPTFYDKLIEHVVSHGFLVVATNTSNTGSAKEMLQAVDWAIAQSAMSSSPLYNRVDPERIGAFGHSQGGSGTCNAGLDPRIDTIVPLSGVPLDADASVATLPNIKGPIFFVNTADEAASATRIEDAFNLAKAPSVYGVTMIGNHDEYTDIADDPGVPGLTSNDAKQSRAAVAAWFAWQLQGKSALRELFVGPTCGFCAGSTWKTIKSKGF